MFDLTVGKTSHVELDAELPDADEQWTIGAIVGPSGSGKSTIARHAYGERVYGGRRWPKQKAVIDGFGDLSVKTITPVLTAVGFSSPPAWVKPYDVLSGGERFRCDLARALLAGGELVVFDEFTSVVDRTVAKIGSAAVSKAIRGGKIAKRFVAVTCHYDVLEWLEPDWTLDMATGRLERRRLRRPEIQLQVAPVHHSAWRLFRRHHYLNTSIHRGAICFAAFWHGEPVAFSSWMTMVRAGEKNRRREHRTVVLPDYQGVGIGNRLSAYCASILTGAGLRAFSTTSHPAMIRHRWQSPLWRTRRFGMCSPSGKTTTEPELKATSSAARVTGGFEYVGPAMDREQALAMLSARPQPFALDERTTDLAARIAARPGATIKYLARSSGATTADVRRRVNKLIDAGRVREIRERGLPAAFYRSASS